MEMEGSNLKNVEMYKIYLIFIITCLTEQLKANVYHVKPTEALRRNNFIVNIRYDPYYTLNIVFNNDVNQGHITVNVVSYDPEKENVVEVQLDDPCNMDPSTEEGTLAAMFWTSLGIDSCPIAAGDYKIADEFNQTGIIENMFRSVDELITITFEPQSHSENTSYTLFAQVRFVEESP